MRTTGELAHRPALSGAVAKPAAVYDTVTEGLTGWQFLRTWRWAGYAAIAVVFALVCASLALWQYDRGREASADNALVNTNFSAPVEPLTKALPTTSSYDPGQVWRRVSMRGTWDASHQYYLRNSVRSSETGFRVITALKLSTGGTILIDRGWVASSPASSSVPSKKPAPPSGAVDVVARLQGSQPKKGEGGVVNDQIVSVDLSELAPRIGGTVYSAAYGVIVSPSSTSQGLKRVQATAPAEGVGYHYSYMIQWILFALIGFFLLWRATVREFRRLNADDPEEQAREAERVRKTSRRGFTDEEIEDEALDGFVPLGRWGGRSSLAAGESAQRRSALQAPGERAGLEQHAFRGTDDSGEVDDSSGDSGDDPSDSENDPSDGENGPVHQG
ncbi:SURF1 family protein [Humibacter albus]|uniref:SURF1 family cytochrome oxidase biogenesis protein n=1 Tax=Humibacter albus TaxID=427754 RepID=UPI0003B78365|nr:SURF1 family protein [Humibacter albus]